VLFLFLFRQRAEEHYWKRFEIEFGEFVSFGIPVSGTLKYLLEGDVWSFWRCADSWRKKNIGRMLTYIADSGVDCYGSRKAYQDYQAAIRNEGEH